MLGVCSTEYSVEVGVEGMVQVFCSRGDTVEVRVVGNGASEFGRSGC